MKNIKSVSRFFSIVFALVALINLVSLGGLAQWVYFQFYPYAPSSVATDYLFQFTLIPSAICMVIAVILDTRYRK